MALILVVEDDEDHQELVTRFLRQQRHRVVAADGLGGVKTAHECLPDLILMDLGLPGIDGWDATQRIPANPETANIPIIALTAHALSEDVSRAIDVRIDAYETN